MKKLWTWRKIDASADLLWQLLTDLDEWPKWGPSLTDASLDGEKLEAGATGTITTVLGITLRFEITNHTNRQRWGWKVAGIPATDHCVTERGPNQCEVGFGVPWVAAPYLAVCEVALRRLDAIATKKQRSNQ